MKPFVKKYSPWFLLVAMMAFIPWWLSKIQHPPELDQHTLEATNRWIDTETERIYGPSNTAGWSEVRDAVKGPLEDASTKMNRFSRFGNWAEVLENDYQELVSEHDKLLNMIKSAAEKGTSYKQLSTILTEENIEDYSSTGYFLAAQSYGKSRRIIAQRAMAHHDWNTVLHELEKIEKVSHVIEPGPLINKLIAIAIRNIMYHGYRDMLAYSPPNEILKRAADQLRRIRSKESPEYLVWLTENALIHKISNSHISKHSTSWKDSGVYAGYSVVNRLTWKPELIHDSRLRAWAWQYQQDDIMRLILSGAKYDQFAYRGLKWTSNPAAQKYMTRLIEDQPEILDALIPGFKKAKSDLENPDLLTLAYLLTPPIWSYYSEARMRFNVVKWKGRVTEAAFRTRIFRTEHDRWPETIAELNMTNIADSTQPSLRIAWHETDSDLRNALWRTLRLRNQFWSPKRNHSDKPSVINRVSSLYRFSDTIHLLANTQAIQRRTKLVTSAECTWRIITDNPRFTVPENLNVSSRPLTNAQAQQIVAWARKNPDKGQANNLLPFGEKQNDSSETIDPVWILQNGGVVNPEDLEESIMLPIKIESRVELRAPERVLVIWTAGPDGVDDQGRIAYDTTNGTRSRGDILAFPEEY